MRALEIITGQVIYNPAYTNKFQLKTTHYIIRAHSRTLLNVFWQSLYLGG
jgi:hypothetical protein